MSLTDLDDIDCLIVQEIFEFSNKKGKEIREFILSKFPDEDKKSYFQTIKAISFILSTFLTCISDKKDRNNLIDEIAIMLKGLSRDMLLMVDEIKEH